MREKYTVRNWLIAAIALELVVLLSLSGVVYAKYVAEKKLNGTITIHAELGKIALYEHKANKNASGQYELNTDETVSGNTYDTVIPGLDIPKDPYIEITDKTEIPAYVFLLVHETDWPNTMGYQLEEHWKLLSGYDNVYVYADHDGPIKVTGDIETIKIIKNDVIIVSQEYIGPDEANLTFSACMGQVGTKGDNTDMTANDVYSFIKSSS